MKCSLFLLSLVILALGGCSSFSSNKEDGVDERAYTDALEKAAKDSVKSFANEPYKPHKVTLSNCQTIHKHNLETDDTIIDYVTVSNETDQSIKGIEVITNKFDEIKIKIKIPPHSSKKIKAKGFDCSSSDVSGIFYTNGKYEEQQWSVSTPSELGN